MKKLTSILFVLILLLVFSVSAFADISMCTAKEVVNVYTEQDIGSAVVKTLAKGVEVQVKEKGEEWCTVADGFIRDGPRVGDRLNEAGLARPGLAADENVGFHVT